MSLKNSKAKQAEKEEELVILLALLSVPEWRAELSQATTDSECPLPEVGALSYDQLAYYLGVSVSWVRRTEQNALRKCHLFFAQEITNYQLKEKSWKQN